MENSLSSLTALVTINNDTPLADSRVIAEKLGITHKSMMQLINDYLPNIEKHFDQVRFENEAVKTSTSRGTKYQKYALLTEPQTYYVLRLGENTPKSLEVNAIFIKAFMELKAQNELLAKANTILAAKRTHILPPRLLDEIDVIVTRLHHETKQEDIEQLYSLIQTVQTSNNEINSQLVALRTGTHLES